MDRVAKVSMVISRIAPHQCLVYKHIDHWLDHRTLDTCSDTGCRGEDDDDDRVGGGSKEMMSHDGVIMHYARPPACPPVWYWRSYTRAVYSNSTGHVGHVICIQEIFFSFMYQGFPVFIMAC